VRPDPLCFDLMRVGTFFANHRTPKDFEFALDRQQLLPNAASERFARDITELVHAGYREFLATTNSQDSATIAALYDQAQMHGGNVYDTFTGSELSKAAEHHPDLLCFRLFPVSQDSDLNQVKPGHFDLNELRRLTGTVYLIQKRVDKQIQGARFLSFDHEGPNGLTIVYKAVQTWMTAGLATQPAYVMEANRLGSMLFDADRDSLVKFVDAEPFGPICIQVVNLERAALTPLQKTYSPRSKDNGRGLCICAASKHPATSHTSFLAGIVCSWNDQASLQSIFKHFVPPVDA
jgi:hypothetical protein